MSTNYHHKAPDAVELTDKLRFAAVSMPLLGVVGGVLRVLDVPIRISLGVIVPVFVVLFVLTFFRRADTWRRDERVERDHRQDTRHRRARAAV